VGYFFCLEDRALLCRQCDVAIHTTSPYVSSHQRFLITGIRVALQQYFTNNISNCASSNSNGATPSSSIGDTSRNPPSSSGTLSDSLGSKKTPTVRAVPGAIDDTQQWSWNEILLENAEFEQCYGFSEPGSSS
jgi:hypothetical protein